MSIIGEYYEDEIIPLLRERISTLEGDKRVLEAKILSFRAIIRGWPGFLNQYDEYFGITNERYGNKSTASSD